jgi:hypothetical protein
VARSVDAPPRARYPHYGWERNKGYGTPEHREAPCAHGLTPHHRRSFQPVEQLTLLPDMPRRMTESIERLRPSWIAFGWFIAAAVTSLILLASSRSG